MENDSTFGKNPDEAHNSAHGGDDVEYVEIVDDGSYEYYEEYEDDDSVEEFDPPPYATPFPFPPPPPPPPPMAHGLVPPPSRGPLRRWQPAPPPPPEFVYEEEIVEESDSPDREDDVSENVPVEYVSDDGLPPQPAPVRSGAVSPENARPTPAKISQMKTEEFSRMLKMGQTQESIVKSGRVMMFVGGILKILASVLVVCALIAGCAFVVYSYFLPKKEDSYVADSGSPKSSPIAWNVPEGRTRACLAHFYEAVGLSDMSDFGGDILMKGEIRRGKRTDGMYCIAKRGEGISYIKIGTGDTSAAFFVDKFLNGVKHLVNGGMSGERRELNDKYSLVVRALVAFDGSLSRRALMHGYAKNDFMNIYNEGDSEKNGKLCRSLRVDEEDGTVVLFNFDVSNGLLYSAVYKRAGVSVEVVYSDYKPVDGTTAFPFRREIFVDSQKYADVDFDLIAKRDGLIFPN